MDGETEETRETTPMKPATRRSFLETSVLAACGVAAATRSRVEAAAGEYWLDRTGVALYTVRDLMKDPAPTLEAIAKLGYRYVEGALLPSIAPLVKAAGLKQASAYVPTYLVTGNREAWADRPGLLPESYTWEDAIGEAKGRGLQYLVVTYLRKAERGNLDAYRRVSAQLDKAGEACRKEGITLAYHAHAFEYEPIDGVRPLDLMLKETSPEHLALELDTFWASIAGQDPVAMLAAHKGRIPLVHLKDKAAGTPVQYDETKVPKEAFKEVGNGIVDFAAFFKLAAQAGVQYCNVEQDYCVGSTPLDSLQTSYANIRKLTAGLRG
jgi:sugar phosphate isomerase/epimerase